MRTITSAERAYISDPKGHWCFAYLEVSNDAGTLLNLGALAIGGDPLRDFGNTAQLSDTIDANTISFSATLKRDVDLVSLSPFRTDSDANASELSPGTYAPLLDLHRRWRIMVALMPRGSTPDVSDYREMATGLIDTLVVNGLSDTIEITGRGMEADLLDAFVVPDPSLPGRDANGDRPYSGAMEDVIQDALDDQMGVDVVPLYTPVSPSFSVTDAIGDINLMPAVADIAALTAWVLRYRYDASDVLRFTLFDPPRNAVTPDWSITQVEYEDLSASIDISGVRNYIKVRYMDAVGGLTTVISPAAEPAPVSCTGGVATFLSSQAGVIDDGTIIVVDDVGYVVSGFNGTTGCTLAGAPDFSNKAWYTSASITRYGLRTMVIDLSAKTQITDSTAAGNLASGARSDQEDPALTQQFKAPGLWFVDLHDFITTTANDVLYDTDQSGGVTSYSHTFADAMLETTVGLSGKPKGRYTSWKRIGTGTGTGGGPSSSVVLPELDYVSAQFYDSGAYIGAAPFGSFIYSANPGPRCFSIRVQHGTDPAFLVGTTTVDFPNGFLLDGFTLSSSADRDKTYYFRFIPYSGGIVSGAVSGIAGLPVDRQVYVPPIPVNSTSVTFSRSVSGELTATVLPDAGTVLGVIGDKEYFFLAAIDTQPLQLSTIPATEGEVGTEYRRQRDLTGAVSARINANIETLTGTPTIKIKSTTNAFAAVTDLITWVPGGTGLRSSGWVSIPGGARTDVGLTFYLADGAGTAVLNLFELDVEFRAATATTGRIHTSAFVAAFD